MTRLEEDPQAKAVATAMSWRQLEAMQVIKLASVKPLCELPVAVGILSF